MHITVIRHSIRNRGGDRLVLDYLAYLISRGHKITYWTNEVNTCFPIHPDIQIKMIPFKGVAGTILFTLLTRFPSDILIVDLVVMAYFASVRNRTKILMLAQDDDVSYHKSSLIKKFTAFCYKTVLNKLAVSAVSVSEGLTQRLNQYHPQNLTTISNGVELNSFYRESNSKYISLRQKPFVITLFCRQDYRKGLDIAKKTIEELQKIHPIQNWEIWAIGSEKLEIPGISIRHLGFLKTDEELRSVFSASDIYLVPSRSEGLSLLLLQALACQCIIVSTSASYIISNEQNGLISPIENWSNLAKNLVRVIEESDLRVRLKAGARKLAEQFDIQISYQKFEQKIIDVYQTRKLL